MELLSWTSAALGAIISSAIWIVLHVRAKWNHHETRRTLVDERRRNEARMQQAARFWRVRFFTPVTPEAPARDLSGGSRENSTEPEIGPLKEPAAAVLAGHADGGFHRGNGRMLPAGKLTEYHLAFLRVLPEGEFGRAEYNAAAEQVRISERTAQRYINMFCERGLVTRLAFGRFERRQTLLAFSEMPGLSLGVPAAVTRSTGTQGAPEGQSGRPDQPHPKESLRGVVFITVVPSDRITVPAVFQRLPVPFRVLVCILNPKQPAENAECGIRNDDNPASVQRPPSVPSTSVQRPSMPLRASVQRPPSVQTASGSERPGPTPDQENSGHDHQK